eukprot:4621092-Amphidinium_carterae.1
MATTQVSNVTRHETGLIMSIRTRTLLLLSGCVNLAPGAPDKGNAMSWNGTNLTHTCAHAKTETIRKKPRSCSNAERTPRHSSTEQLQSLGGQPPPLSPF